MSIMLQNRTIRVPRVSEINYYLDATTATIENPLSVGGQWELSLDLGNFPTGGRIDTMSGGPKGIVGYTGSSFHDDVSRLAGSQWLPNQCVITTIYNSGSALGNYEHELHTNSSSINSTDQRCYAVATVILNSMQLGKWTGPFKTIGGNDGPIILRNQIAIPGGPLVTGDKMGMLTTGPAALRRIRCFVRRLGFSGPNNGIGPFDDVVLDFLDDGTNGGTLGGDAPENRNPSGDTVSTDNTPPLITGNPGLGFDNAFTEMLLAGFTDYRAVTMPLG